ncbi:GntR family transcriptional regulator [Mesorhizobium sp. NZP2298]|uniref:GntR family transcriptional regulator n=1 Tax=Mesorhizobium sp. NZP2298 TaxID=2483403 RepID=UPI001555D115|nr:GntR family transcriptional regulator [Mesorhizobium sp. NZP2298]QKC98347.1 GntR family transcriptional regulator [Mesorhizobium sp. NZP2298]
MSHDDADTFSNEAGRNGRNGNSEDVDSSANLLGHRVATALRKSILGGQLAPGSRIRQEDLAQQFGVSRIPVREALRQLESDGLVVLRANSGAWVAKIDLPEFIEIYKIRERLEPLAIRESLRNLSDEQIRHLNELREQINHSQSVEEFLQLDREFHLLSYAGANMTTLREMIERFWNTTQHYRRAFTQGAGNEGTWIIHAEHRLLTEALKRRDEDEAERILLGHIRRTRLELTKRAKELGLQ